MATRASARIVKHAAFVGKNAFISSVPRLQLRPCSSRCLSSLGKRQPKYISLRQSMNINLRTCTQQSRQRSSASYLSIKEDEMGDNEEEGSFEKFGISNLVQQKLRARGITHLFPVQYKAYEHSMAGNDVIIQARTGTGKTLSFAIPLVEKLLQEGNTAKYGRNPKVLVLTPTRELANQVKEDFQGLSHDLRVLGVYGGTPYSQQTRDLRSGVDVVVGTPGRMNDLIQQGQLRLADVQHVVLDEVDSMLDFGFKEQVENIITTCYQKADKPQTMLYSATMPPWVITTAKKYLNDNYQFLNFVSAESVKTATTIEQYAVQCRSSEHEMLIQNLLHQFTGSEGRAIVFCEMKKEVDKLAFGALSKISRGLHGDKSQSEREKILKGFKNQEFRILITTSVAARGLDIPDVPLVIQTSPPNNSDDYIHRVGRTGRAGKSGIAVCLYEPSERREIYELERIANKKFKHLEKPSDSDVLELTLKGCIERLDNVPEDIKAMCRETAEQVIEDKGATEALAAAIALVGQLDNLFNKSLISGAQGFRTLLFRSEFGDTTIKYLKNQLYDILPDTAIRDVAYTRQRKAIVFDVQADSVNQLIQELEAREGSGTVEILRQLPDLEPVNSFSAEGNRFRKARDSRSDNRSNGYGHRSSSADRYHGHSHRRTGIADRYRSRDDSYGYRQRSRDDFSGWDRKQNVIQRITRPQGPQDQDGSSQQRDSFMRRPRFDGFEE